MKKRKELDALVSNVKIGSNKRIGLSKKASGSCSAHELLRHDTDSSDMEDFSILQPRRKGRKKHGSRFCITSVCLSLCQFILVTTSCLVSGALIWLHIGLREDIDLLRTHLQKVEAGNRNTPEALHVIHSNLKQLDSNVSVLYSDVRKNLVDIENMTNEVKHLKDIAGSLKESIAAAPAIQQLPKDMHSLSESVANFGSKMNALESNIKELKDQQSNIQTTAQNLSGELEAMKVSLQDLTNSSDFQAKSSLNMTGKDLKFQTTVQETSRQVNYLQGQLRDVAKSVDQINATFTSHMNVYSELSGKVETVNDAMVLINNSSLSHNDRLLALENFIHSNLSLQFDQLDPEKFNSFKKSGVPNMEDYVNRSISEVILQVINKDIFRTTNPNTKENSLQALEQTHDVLVLLAALLQKYKQIPKTYILNDMNATEIIESMLHQSFEEMMTSRDLKIETIERDIQNLTSCISPNSHNQQAVTENHNMEDLTTPVFVQSPLRTDVPIPQNDNTQKMLADVLG